LQSHLNVHSIPSTLTPVQPALPRTFRDILKIGGEAPLMVTIPAGRFLMGFSKDEPNQQYYEEPLHEVLISDSFALAVYAVTFDDYDRFCGSTFQAKPDDQNWGRGRRQPSMFPGSKHKNTVGGFVNRPVGAIDYRARPNGNTPAVLEPRPRFILVTELQWIRQTLMGTTRLTGRQRANTESRPYP
jgi:hypothetical protein